MESQNHIRGLQLFELGRFVDAISYLKKAIGEDSQSFETKYYLALSYFNIDEIEKSKELTYSILSENPDNEYVHFLLSQIYFSLSNFDKATHHIDISIKLNVTEADFFGQKSYIKLNRKKYNEALEIANEGLNIEPNNELCLNARIQALTKLDKKTEASSTIENLLEKDPENAYSHTNVGWSNLENGNNKKALEHFKEALSIDPNFDYAREGMSTALKSKNFLYNLYLKYSFWISKKSSKQQWFFIIGLYLVYRFSVKFISNTEYSFLIYPIVVLYLFFALGTWIMESLSNGILIFDNYGKYLLDKDERKSGESFIILILLSILAIVSYFFIKNNYLLLASFTFLCTIIPIPRAFLKDSKKSKLFSFSIGILMLIIGLLGFLYIEDYFTLGITIFITLIAYTWLDNIIK